MIRFLGLAAAAVMGALLWAAPAAALRPAPVIAPQSLAEPAQFRFPWEERAKPKRRAKRTPRAEKKPPRTAPAATKREKQRRPAAPAKPVDPMDAALPALMAPAGLALLGATRREADQWAALGREAPPPPILPPFPEDGPAPAPAYVAALLASIQRGDPSGIIDGPDDGEDEAPDIHVPLPPVRPPAPGEPVAAAPPSELPPPSDGVPLPTARPGAQTAAVEPTAPLPPEPPPGPSAPAIELPTTSHADDPACATLADKEFAVSEEIPPIVGPGACGGGPLVLLSGVKRKDGGLITIKPVATLRCAMAKELAEYLRDDLAPAAKLSGAELERLDIAGSFQCRGRNGALGGRMSEHGRANAVDLSGFGLSNGRNFSIYASDLPQALADKAKSGACEHFSTVLGPGSDGFHETHLHIDLQPRRGKSKLCQWSDPEVARAGAPGKTDAERAAASPGAERKDAPDPPRDKAP